MYFRSIKYGIHYTHNTGTPVDKLPPLPTDEPERDAYSKPVETGKLFGSESLMDSDYLPIIHDGDDDKDDDSEIYRLSYNGPFILQTVLSSRGYNNKSMDFEYLGNNSISTLETDSMSTIATTSFPDMMHFKRRKVQSRYRTGNHQFENRSRRKKKRAARKRNSRAVL